MVPKFSRKDVVNFNEETLYKEYKDYLNKDNDYLFKNMLILTNLLINHK